VADFGWADILASYHLGLRLALYAGAVLVFLSGVDDFLLDIAHHLTTLYRRFIVMRRYRPMTVADLKDLPEQRTVILVPAWREEDVIGAMLSNLTGTLDYGAYEVLVGIYPNDAATAAAVTAAARHAPNIHIVTTPRPGPTSKGDCLNALIDHAFRLERSGQPFGIFVLHDAEDIPHPLELKLFNKLIPRKDMVQLPVLPLEAPLWGLTAGHYMDEFAEHHSKDLPLREILTHAVPSAGVGCAFSRGAILALKARNGGPVFSMRSLTEDYEVAMRLQEMGRRLIFVRFAVEEETGRKARRQLVGTREFFPATLSAATRQKARWLTGIVFQAWRHFGWRGPLPMKYAFFRDRKAIATAQIAIFAYAVALGVVLAWLIRVTGLVPYRYPALVPKGSLLESLLIINAFFLLNRVGHRACYVWSLYGAKHAMMVPLRLLWGNYINFLAASLALWQVTKSLLSGRPIGWSKTAHRFPAEAELAPYRKRLGALLVEKRMVAHADIESALAEQALTRRSLGEILTGRGLLDEESMLRLVARQRGLLYWDGSQKIAAPFEGPPPPLPPDAAVIGKDGSTLLIACARLMENEEKAAIAARSGAPLRQVLAPRRIVERHLMAEA
jgi:adsorption protein B